MDGPGPGEGKSINHAVVDISQLLSLNADRLCEIIGSWAVVDDGGSTRVPLLIIRVPNLESSNFSTVGIATGDLAVYNLNLIQHMLSEVLPTDQTAQ